MQPTDHMSTAVEYSCGEKNKHGGNSQKSSSLPPPPARKEKDCGCSPIAFWASAVWLKQSLCSTTPATTCGIWWLTSQMLHRCCLLMEIHLWDQQSRWCNQSEKKVHHLCVWNVSCCLGISSDIPFEVCKTWDLTLAPSSRSGDRYHRVTTTGVYCFRGEPYSRAKPKSPI